MTIAGKEKAKIKVKMTRDGLIEENCDGSIKDQSQERGRPENKEEFQPERNEKRLRAKIQNRGRKRLQMEKWKSSVRQETVETFEVTPEEKVSGYRKKIVK